VGDKVLDVGEEVMEKAKTITENVGEKVLDKGGDALEKAKDIAENVGGKVLETGGTILGGLKDKAEDLGEKLKEKGKDFYDKAQEAAAKESGDIVDDAADAVADSTEQLDETVEQAKKAADSIEEQFRQGEETRSKLSQSELENKGDFWSNAEKYADGDYHSFKEEPKIKIHGCSCRGCYRFSRE
jgi:DNA-binding ferritin-like protein